MPFCLVEAWELQGGHKKALLDQICDLKNGTLKPRTPPRPASASGLKTRPAPLFTFLSGTGWRMLPPLPIVA